MFDHHRKSPWFAEKYDPAPEFQELRTRVRKEGWKGRLITFLQDLEAGKFDNPNEPEPTSPVKENPQNGETETNGTASVAEKPTADDEMQFNMDADDDGQDNDGNRAETNGRTSSDKKRGTDQRLDETSVLPEGNQVMIRTIPPDIGRVKLEEVSILRARRLRRPLNLALQACNKTPGFVYLALGDPLQKRNYYRAGWMRFTDDADMNLVMNELSEKKV
jgi:hypothetical protein